MRVCITASEVYEPRFGYEAAGGVSVAVRELCHQFRERGIETFVITNQNGCQRPVEVIDNGTVVLIDWLRRRENKIHNAMRLMHIPPWRSYKLVNPDLFNLHMLGQMQYMPFRYMPRTPKVVSLQYPVDREQGDLNLHDSRIQHILRNADAFTTATTDYLPELYRQVPFMKDKEIHHIYNPLSIPKENSKIRKPKKIKLLWLNRMADRKQPWEFVGLANKFPELDFVMAGRGMDRYKLYEGQKPDNLTIYGYISHEKKTELLRESSILVNTSRGEGLPVTFQEALAHKCVILSSKAVNPENLAGRFGEAADASFIWGVEDTNFKDALKRLLDKNIRKLGKEGFEYAKAAYDPKHIAKEYIKVYEKVI